MPDINILRKKYAIHFPTRLVSFSVICHVKYMDVKDLRV